MILAVLSSLGAVGASLPWADIIAVGVCVLAVAFINALTRSKDI